MPEPLVFTIVFIACAMVFAFLMFEGGLLSRLAAMARVGLSLTVIGGAVWYFYAFAHLAIKYW